jgi:hypothetical protein
MKFGIIDFMMALLQVAFIVMKLCGAISWSWWLVMLPTLLIVVLNILVLFLYVFAGVYKSRQLIKQYGTDNKLAIRLKKMQQEREELERERNNVLTKR